MKKQGVLPLTFDDPDLYGKIGENDRVSILGLGELEPGSKLDLVITHPDGSSDRGTLSHSLSASQIEWFKAGSALNLIRQMRGQ